MQKRFMFKHSKIYHFFNDNGVAQENDIVNK